MNASNITFALVLIQLLPWACVFVASLFAPKWTRPDLFFAVTVDPSFRDSEMGRKIVRDYRMMVLLVSVIALMTIGLLPISSKFLFAGLQTPTFIEIAGCFGAFLVARRRTMPHHVAATTEREADLAPRTVPLPGGLLGQAGPFLVLAAFAFFLAWNWQRLPDRFPIHWGLDGTPNAWSTKGFATVFGTLIIALILCGIMSAITIAVSRNARRINNKSAGQEKQFIRGVSVFMLGLEYWMALIFGLAALSALRADQKFSLPLWFILAGPVVLIGALFWIGMRMGQGGSRLGSKDKKAGAADAQPVGDRTPDECWKLGVFYFNRNDPAVWVEKRFGMGYTVNMAQPAAWILLGALLFFSVGSIVFSVWMAHPK